MDVSCPLPDDTMPSACLVLQTQRPWLEVSNSSREGGAPWLAQLSPPLSQGSSLSAYHGHLFLIHSLTDRYPPTLPTLQTGRPFNFVKPNSTLVLSGCTTSVIRSVECFSEQ